MRRLRWVAMSFLMTALIGLTAAAWLVSGLGMPYLFAFTGVYMVFYTFFGMKYINYPAEFGRIAPVIADDVPEPLAAGVKYPYGARRMDRRERVCPPGAFAGVAGPRGRVQPQLPVAVCQLRVGA